MHGYQEGDTTPVDDQESIRRHHTRDTVEKQFNETFCHLLKGVCADVDPDFFKLFLIIINFDSISTMITSQLDQSVDEALCPASS